ncbi:MAG: acyltransferase family protein [Mycetocola sp.]
MTDLAESTRQARKHQAAEHRTQRQRADIQGLRALAVGLVLVFHLWPAALPGGFVGVDVFFVVSGFLITSHLLNELRRTGTVSLPAFWARRARRLLPASLTVLAVTTVLAIAVAPVGLLGSWLSEIVASSFYVENWSLAAKAIDYSAAEAPASPVQHFWSLSVEEQFYLVWPVLLLGAAAAARRTGRGRSVVAVALGAVVAVSLVWSIVFTARDDAAAYVVTTTRAWEFGLGGLLAALAPAAARLPVVVRGQTARGALAWSGLAAILAAAFAFGESTAFPGAAALLPCLGTAAVLAATEPEAGWAPTRLLAVRPVQALGDLSYSVYLWHWPLLVLVPVALGRGLGTLDLWALAGASVALAWLTARFVERPVRSGAFARRAPRVTFVSVAAGMAVVVGAAAGGMIVTTDRLAAEQARVEALVVEAPECLGAAAREEPERCEEQAAEAQPIPDAALAAASPERCIADLREAELTVCAYGEEDGRQTVALLGDSHAEQWLPALEAVAAERDWRLVVLAKSSCAFGPDQRVEEESSPEVLEQMNSSCRDWNERALAWLEQHPEVGTVFTSTRARNRVVAEDGRSWQQTAIDQYHDRWKGLPESIDDIVVLRDTPRMPPDVLACVTEAGSDAAATCAVPVDDALARDPVAEAALTASDDRVALLDLSDYFCSAGSCAPVVGGVLAYRDSHHMSWVFARTLAPYLGERIDGVLGR